MDLARLRLCKRCGLILLSFASSPEKIAVLPRWCPDWNKIDESGSLQQLPRRYTRDYDSEHSALFQSMVCCNNDPKYARIADFPICIVVHSLRPKASSTNRDTKFFARGWLSWQPTALCKFKSLRNSSSDLYCILQRHLRRLLMDTNAHDGNTYSTKPIAPNDWPELIWCYEEAIKFCEELIASPEPLYTNGIRAGGNSGYDFLRGPATWHSGTYFFTDRRQLGQRVPRERTEDVLVAFHTAPVGFILRYQDGSGIAELIGEVYSEDFKDFDTLRAEGKACEWLTIG